MRWQTFHVKHHLKNVIIICYYNLQSDDFRSIWIIHNIIGDSDSDEEKEELTAEEKAEQVELENLRLEEVEAKAKKMADIKAGRIIPDATIQPMSDPGSSSDDNEPPLLGEYDPDDLRLRILLLFF